MLEKENYLTLPDLILIDGGKGQYSSVKEVLDELGLHDLPMIAIAKGKIRNSGDETFFFNGKSYKFEKNDPTLFFMQRLRDEAHRFAITSHRAKRAKGLSKSLLDQIDGIGAIRKRALLNHFGSARAVESASFDEIKSVEITTHDSAIRIISKVGELNNPADRDHCLQYMVAIGLLKGDLVAEDYEDDVAADPRIDKLRSKMVISEDKRYSAEYHEADKRSIANKIQIHFTDGSATEAIEVEYPIGHKRRREEGIPVLEKKFRKNLELTYKKEKADDIFNICINQNELENMSVIDFQQMLSLS